MKIIRNSVVALKIDLLDADGKVVQRTGDDEPYVYLHGGHHGIFPRVEEELAGKAAGEKVRVKLAADEAFGRHDPDLVRVEARERFPGKVKVGMQFEGETAHGDHTHPMVFRVVGVTDTEVTVDANHPLAGKEIEVRATVLDVRPASPEEMQHGHAHGPGGHHHD